MGEDEDSPRGDEPMYEPWRDEFTDTTVLKAVQLARDGANERCARQITDALKAPVEPKEIP